MIEVGVLEDEDRFVIGMNDDGFANLPTLLRVEKEVEQ